MGRKPLDLIGKAVGAGHLHRRRQVDDAGSLRSRLPLIHDRLADLQRIVRLGRGEALRRILEGPAGLRVTGRGQTHPPGTLDGNRLDPLTVAPEYPVPLHRGGGVVEVDDGARCPGQGLEGAMDQIFPRLDQDLDGHLRRNLVFVDQPAHEVEVRLAGRREADLDLLQSQTHQQLPQPSLLRRTHGFEQGLVAVAQVHAGPDGGLLDGPVRPLPVGHGQHRAGGIFTVVEGSHGHLLRLLSS